MQNNRTGMLATSVPVAVVPNALRWPSWKIHTRAPNAAVSDNTFSTTAFSGSVTLPVKRTSNPNVMIAITPSTQGSRVVMASTLSRLTCAMPANWTVRPSGAPTACNRSSWASDASENNGAVLPTLRKALPRATYPLGDGGATRAPPTNVPAGPDTVDTSGTRDRSTE